MRVVRRRPAEGVVHERRGQERAVRQVLQPAAAALVAHEDVELAVGTESHHAAVVVAVLGVGVVGAGVAGHRRCCRSAGSAAGSCCCRTSASTPFQMKRSTRLPSSGTSLDAAGVRAGAALGPADVDPRVRREVRVQHHAQQPALGVGVHGEIEHRRRLDDAVDHTLDLAGCLLEHQEIVGAEEDDPDRLGDAGVEDRRDLEVEGDIAAGILSTARLPADSIATSNTTPTVQTLVETIRYFPPIPGYR